MPLAARRAPAPAPTQPCISAPAPTRALSHCQSARLPTQALAHVDRSRRPRRPVTAQDMMASTGFFRHPNGDERIISVIVKDDKKDLVVVATTASDISNAAKFLTRDFETRVVEGSEDAELFLDSKIRFVVICYEDFDMRLADAFAKANIPIRVVSMDMIESKCPYPIIVPTKKMREHVQSLMRQTCIGTGTVVDDATWIQMNESFNATPLRKQKQWKYELHGSDGTSIVKNINGEFVDHNAQTGEPQMVKPISSFEDATCVPVTERGDGVMTVFSYFKKVEMKIQNLAPERDSHSYKHRCNAAAKTARRQFARLPVQGVGTGAGTRRI